MIHIPPLSPRMKTWARRAAVALAAIWMIAVTWSSCAHHSVAKARRLDSIGGLVLNGGGGISKVTTNSSGLLAGSGTVSNPLTATISQGSGLSGTGSSGSPLVVGCGSGMTCAADSVLVNNGTNLTFSSGALTIQSSPTFVGSTGVTDLVTSGITRFTGVTTAPGLSGNTNNWNPEGDGDLSTTYVIDETPTANVTITGLVAGAAGQQVTIINRATSYSLALTSEDANSTAGNRFVFPGGHASRVGPGGAVILYYSSAASRWYPASMPTTIIDNRYEGLHLEWVDEFMYGSGTPADNSKMGVMWGVNLSSGTFSGTAATGANTRPGIGELGSGVGTASRFGIQNSPNSVDFGAGIWNYQTTIGFPTLSTSGEEYSGVVGFFDVLSSVNQVDGCYFLYDRGNVATSGPNSGNADKFSCWCASNSTRTTFLMDGSTVSNESFTTVNAPVAALTLPDTNIYTLEVRMTGTTRAEFFVNGTKSCDINTNIPSGASRLTAGSLLIIKSAGTTARQMDVDRVRLAVDLNARRSP